MNKKVLLFTSIGMVFATGIGAVAIGGSNQMNRLSFKASATNRVVEFVAGDLANVEIADADYYAYSFSLSHSTAGGTDTIDAIPYDKASGHGSYIYAEYADEIDVSGDYLVKLSNHYVEAEYYYSQPALYLYLPLFEGASLITANSYMSISYDGGKNYETKPYTSTDIFEGDNGIYYTSYYYYILTSYGADSTIINKIHLEYTC